MQKKIIHPNILRQYDTVEINENEFATVLEYCEGPDLSAYLKKNKNINEKEAKVIIKQVLSALKCLNENKDGKIIHYDLKPANIIFHKGVVKVADFGLCKLIERGEKKTDLTSFGVGTYWYLPPEAFEYEESRPTQISTKVDIWSLGVIFFEMLYCQKPFGHGLSQQEVMKNKVMLRATKVEFPEKPVVSNETKEFIRNCLCYDQEKRYDINEACEALCK